MKKKVIELRRKIYNYLKDKALSYEGGKSQELKTYQKDQDIFSQNTFSASDMDSLIASSSNSEIIYLGDFHTFDQNIRNVLRILKVLINKKNNCIVALEMVDAKYQFFIDTYLQGHITDLEFLESIDYHDSWRFPWTHYKLIFELAKKEGIKIIGLNTPGTLKERDLFAAKLIKNSLQNFEDSQVLVLYGELHITKNKIPHDVEKMVDGVKQLIIHQNLDEVYWKQIEEDDDAEIVKFNDFEYCINTAPPWIKYESMIYWYENLSDDPDFDIHEYIIENGKKLFSDDTHENFISICAEMLIAINYKYKQDELENFNLHDHLNLEFVEEKVTSIEPASLLNFYQHLLTSGQSFKLPFENLYYCSSYSMNRLAYLAGTHIYHYILDKTSSNKLQILQVGLQEEKLIYFIYEAMFSFFFSKVINPHRKCEMYLDLRRVSKGAKSKSTKACLELACLVLDKKTFTNELVGIRLSNIHHTALYVGHILGEYFYESMFTRKTKFNLEPLINIQLNLFHFNKVKSQLLKDVQYKKHEKRYF